MRIVKILEVVDTRDYIEDGDRWIPVSGSGDMHECERCGRMHEVHALVQMEDGETAIVGTGCMTAESDEIVSRLKSMSGRAKRIARLESELAAAEEGFVRQVEHEARVDEMPIPPVIIGSKTMPDGITFPTYSCGGSELWGRFGDRTEEARRDWVSGMKGYPHRKRAYQWEETIKQVRRQLRALQSRQSE